MSAAASPSKSMLQPTAPMLRGERTLRVGLAHREQELLHLDLSDLAVPKVNDLHVDELKPSWFARLFRRN